MEWRVPFLFLLLLLLLLPLLLLLLLLLLMYPWSLFAVLHEAVSTGDPELIGMVLCCRDRQQLTQRDKLIPELLERLVAGPDFYIEMKWEFTSWSESLSVVSAAL